MPSGVDEQLVGDEEESEHAKHPVAPLVGGAGERAHEARDDHDLVGQNGDQDRGPGDAGGQEEIREEQRRCDEPVDVPHVEDLTGARGADRRTAPADELDCNRRLAQVGTHGPVGYTGDGRDARGDVVEETVRLGLGHGKAHEDERRHAHHGADREVPVRSVDGNRQIGMVGNHPVDIECLVSGHVDVCVDRLVSQTRVMYTLWACKSDLKIK